MCPQFDLNAYVRNAKILIFKNSKFMRKSLFWAIPLAFGAAIACTPDAIEEKNSQINGPLTSNKEDGHAVDFEDWEAALAENGCAYHLVEAPRPIRDYLDEPEPEKDFIDELLNESALHFANEYCSSTDIVDDLQAHLANRPYYQAMLEDFFAAYPQHYGPFDQMLLSYLGYDFATLQSQTIPWMGYSYELDIAVENWNTCDWTQDPIFLSGIEVDYGDIDYIPGYKVNRGGELCEIKEVLLGKYVPAHYSSEEDTMIIPIDTSCLRNPIIIVGIQTIDYSGKWNGDGASENGQVTYNPFPGCELGKEYVVNSVNTGGQTYDRGGYFDVRWEWRGSNNYQGAGFQSESDASCFGEARLNTSPAT